ncbi:MAG: GNAT family N-acetyltransferase [Alphaproteobacteria bacterium]|nr:MAG: GNAT family N-acetyltransferase [Alphaproteobacteria bacterium]
MLTPHLRPLSEPDDLPFLRALFASTRAQEMAFLPWTDAQKQAFLHQQFDAQHRSYAAYRKPRPERMIVELAGSPVGRLYLHAPAGEIHIVDISLMPAVRGQGLGGLLLRGVIERAECEGRAVYLQVDEVNPARRLYERLGFRITGTNDFRLCMQRPPQAPSA